VRQVDGHDLDQLTEVLSYRPQGRPLAVIARTIKGRGVSFMEDVAKWHHGVPSDHEYQAALAELDAELAAQFAQIPAGRRLLVTNHNSLGNLAERYDFELLGTILPGASTLAEPSAANLSELVEAMSTAGVCTVFAETTAADTLARTVAAELSTCDEVQIVPLYTGALGPAGSGADSYLGMMRANAAAIVQGLQ